MQIRTFYIKLLAPVLLLLSIAYGSDVRAQGWEWTKAADDSAQDQAKCVASDAWGNVYVAGVFSSNQMGFDSIEIFNAGAQNMFLAKYDSSGKALWAKKIGGVVTDGAQSITTDPQGNVYLCGYFQSPALQFGSVHINNYWQTYVEVEKNTSDAFVVKLDSSGNGIWGADIGGAGGDIANGVAIDRNGNVLVCGAFNSDTSYLDSLYVINKGHNNIFTAKFSSAGTPRWIKSFGGTLNDQATAIVADTLGNVFIGGQFTSPMMTIGSSTLYNNGDSSNDVFVAKFSDSGSVEWATATGGSKDDILTSITSDGYSNVYVAGYFSSPHIVFGTDTLTKSSSSFANLFLVRYGNAGAVDWAQTGNSNCSAYPQSLCVDAKNNLYMAGYFSSAILQLGSVTLYNTNGSDGNGNIFLSKFNTTGTPFWAVNAGNKGNDMAITGVSTSLNGNIYVGGWFNTPQLQLGYDVDTNSSYSSDMFVARFNEAKLDAPDLNIQCNPIAIYPNPAMEGFYISVPDSYKFNTVSVYSIQGKFMGEFTMENSTYFCNTFGWPAGTYFVSCGGYHNKVIIK